MNDETGQKPSQEQVGITDAQPAVAPGEAPRKGERHLVLIVPGIRDRGGDWHIPQQEIRRSGFECIVISWGEYFGVPRFLVPAPWFRRAAMRRLEKRIENAISHHTDRTTRQLPNVSFIAHSFGSYILCYLLRKKYHFEVSLLILCGSVLPRSFPFASFATRVGNIVNEVGNKDLWPFIASCVTFGYGTIGTYGYQNAPVTDRFHPRADHAAFTKAGFAAQWWVPLLRASVDGPIECLSPYRPRVEGSVVRTLFALAQMVKWVLVISLVGYGGLIGADALVKNMPCEIHRKLGITTTPCDVTASLDRKFDMSRTGCVDGKRHYDFRYDDTLTFSKPIETYTVAAQLPNEAHVSFRPVGGQWMRELPSRRIVSTAGVNLLARYREMQVNGTSLRYQVEASGPDESGEDIWGIGFTSELPLNGLRVTVILPPGVAIQGIDNRIPSHWQALKDVGCTFEYQGDFAREPVLECKGPVHNTRNIGNYLNWTWNAFPDC